MGPAALIAKQAGYTVSGSDKQNSQYLDYLNKKGITDIHIGQTRTNIAEVHARQPIDWFIYTPAVPKENPNNPELVFCREKNIKMTTREDLINVILSQNKLKLVAVAGTHGKTTTTAMAIWAFKQLDVPISYSVGGKISFGEMSQFEPESEYFVLEADEFDRNFLVFHPFYSIIAGIGWDHHEIYPTEKDYLQAFSQFLAQSQRGLLWQDDIKKLGISEEDEKYTIAYPKELGIEQIELVGLYNRRDAWLIVKAISQITGERPEKLIEIMSRFPGVSRRFEKIAENLYSDYAHTPEKIRGVMNVALETAQKTGQRIVIIYEPLTNRRVHYIKDQHQDIFDGVDALYWVPSYLAREDPNQPILKPAELLKYLDTPTQAVAKAAELDDKLKAVINNHLRSGDLVIGLSGGGGGSLDEWLREKFS